MKRLMLGIVCLVGVVMCSCASKEQTAKYVEEGTSSINHITHAIYGAARSDPTANQEVLDYYEKSFEAFRAQQRAEFASIREEIRRERQEREEFFKAVLGIVASAAPGGSTGVRVAQAIFNAIDNAAKEAKDTSAVEIDKAVEQINDNKSKITDAALKTERVAITAEQLKGMSKEELIALIIAGGSAAGIGGIFGKTGKSRSAGDVKELRNAISELKGRLDLAEEPEKRIGKS